MSTLCKNYGYLMDQSAIITIEEITHVFYISLVVAILVWCYMLRNR
jgi:hypothetical protein